MVASGFVARFLVILVALSFLRLGSSSAPLISALAAADSCFLGCKPDMAVTAREKRDAVLLIQDRSKGYRRNLNGASKL
jgi:hypothetical protein